MFLRLLPPALLVLLQTQTTVYGAGIVPPSARSIPGHSFGARSLTNIPEACQGGCAPFAQFLAGASCPVTQCCSDIFEIGYFSCFLCVGNATKAADFTLAQEYVDIVITSCGTEGFSLPILTFPGQNPDRTLASALPAGASSLPVFAPGPSGSGSAVRSSSSTSSSAHTVTASHSQSASGSGSGSAVSTPASSTSGVSISGSGVSFSGSAPQSSATSPPPQSTFSPTSSPSSSPSPSGSAPPSAGVRVRASVIGVGMAVLLALLL
ncbi:hypothetical protein B0H19DRAFT_1267223 [Mycena capillaripes]|nr:hypothetical protein B0H19DRAFT_1267223 [Mycena capillaripes]